MGLNQETVEKSKYESGILFELVSTRMTDGSYCWDIDIKTSTSFVRFSMVNYEEALRFWEMLFDQSRIIEVSTEDEIWDQEGTWN